MAPVPQLGIFALGTASHAYLEFDLTGGAPPRKPVRALADLRESRTAIKALSGIATVAHETSSWPYRLASSRGPLQRMLESMGGVAGPRDALIRYTTPVSGAHYFVPPLSAVRKYATDPEAG